MNADAAESTASARMRFAGTKDEWELMKKADLLLCEAKRAGRARVWTNK